MAILSASKLGFSIGCRENMGEQIPPVLSCDYRNLENFRVQNFSCNKFSCEKIFVRYATVRKLNARNIFLLDV